MSYGHKGNVDVSEILSLFISTTFCSSKYNIYSRRSENCSHRKPKVGFFSFGIKNVFTLACCIDRNNDNIINTTTTHIHACTHTLTYINI